MNLQEALNNLVAKGAITMQFGGVNDQTIDSIGQKDDFFYDRKEDGVVYKKDVAMREVPTQYRPAIEKAYKKYSKLNRGTIESIMMHESSMGVDDTNKLYDEGAYGWLGGVTKDSAKDARMRGVHDKFDTPEDAIMGIAAIYNDKLSVADDSGKEIGRHHDDSGYITQYWSNPNKLDPAKAAEKFNVRKDFYSRNGERVFPENGILKLDENVEKGLRYAQDIHTLSDKVASRSVY